MDSRNRLALAAILALALALRVAGLGWGLPDEHHLASYHPDEWQICDTALGMAFLGQGPNPHFFNYPSAPIYLAAVVFKVVGVVVPLTDGTKGFFYLLARLLSVGFGVGTVAVAWSLGRRLAGERAGLVAAGLLAVTPLHVVNSHYASVDVQLTFWCALALRLALEPELLVWAGVASGLAASCKYNGVLVLTGIWAAAGLGRAGWRAVLLATGAAAAAFVLTSPFVLLDLQHSLPDLRLELLEHPRTTSIFLEVGPGWLFHLTANLPTGIGWLLPLAAVAGVVGWRRREAALAAFGLLTLASMLHTKELFIRYWLPLTPLVAVAAAQALERLPRRAWLVALLLVATAPLLRSRAYAAMLSQPDARDTALAWCREQIPAGASVGELEPTWFQSVPLRVNNGGHRTRSEHGESRWRLVSDPQRWQLERPEWLVINDVKRAESYRSAAGWAALTAGYRVVRTFENRAVVLPGRVETGRGSRLHDWLYPLPVVLVYRRS